MSRGHISTQLDFRLRDKDSRSNYACFQVLAVTSETRSE